MAASTSPVVTLIPNVRVGTQPVTIATVKPGTPGDQLSGNLISESVVTGASISVEYTAEDLAKLAATRQAITDVYSAAADSAANGAPFTQSQFDEALAQCYALSADVVGKVVYHPGTPSPSLLDRPDSVTFAVGGATENGVYTTETITLAGNPTANVAPIVTLVPNASVTDQAVTIATVKSAIPGDHLQVALNSESLPTGGTLSLEYSVEDLAKLAAVQQGLSDLQGAIDFGNISGNPLSPAQIQAGFTQVYAVAADVVGKVVFHPGTASATKFNGTDAIKFTVSDPTTGGSVTTTENVTLSGSLPSAAQNHVPTVVQTKVNGKQITAHAGDHDTIVLHQGAVADIAGFGGSGDTLDFSKILAEAKVNLKGDIAKLGTYVHVTNAGSDTTLSFDPTGAWKSAGTTIAVLHDAGSPSLATLINQHSVTI